ncbi:MAG: G5 domain-containing protein [Clostridiales Family XIII bacterium]|jgi:LysM repeat protein|nr:G5 domain-containing protein [Clostridiales Family XIII bacterium]
MDKDIKAVEEACTETRAQKPPADALYNKIDAVSGKNIFMTVDQEQEEQRLAEIDEKLSAIFDVEEDEADSAAALRAAIAAASTFLVDHTAQARRALTALLKGILGTLSGGASTFLGKHVSPERLLLIGESLYLVGYFIFVAIRKVGSLPITAFAALRTWAASLRKPSILRPSIPKPSIPGGVVIAVNGLLTRVKHMRRRTWIAISSGATGVLAISLVAFFVISAQPVDVTIGGHNLGYVNNKDEFTKLVNTVREEISEENSDAEIIIDDEKINFAVAPNASGDAVEHIDKDQLKSQLLNSDAVIASAYAITVDGKTFACVATEADADFVMESIVMSYASDASIKHEWVEDVQIQSAAVGLDNLVGTDAAFAALLGSDQEIETYTVETGDTLWGISQKLNKNIEDIQAANPGLDIENIHTGDIIKMTKLVQHVHLKTFEEVTVVEDIPFKTKKIQTDELYKGETKITKAGENGSREVTYEITKVNGEETGRVKLAAKTLKKPKRQTMIVGTTEHPEDAVGSN